MCDHCGCRDLTPVAALMQEHDRLRELSGLIRRHLTANREAAARAEWVQLLVVLGPHVAKEEGFLFPMLSRDVSLAAHVGVLQEEHAGLYDAVDDLDDAGAGWHRGVLAVLHALDEHMFKEDYGLFPAALVTLDGADWDAVDQVGAGPPARSLSPPLQVPSRLTAREALTTRQGRRHATSDVWPEAAVRA